MALPLKPPVERRLLVHGIAELQAGDLLGEQVLDVGGIDLGNVLGRDDAGDDGSVLEGLGGAGAGDDHLVEAGEVLLQADVELLARLLLATQGDDLGHVADIGELHLDLCGGRD